MTEPAIDDRNADQIAYWNGPGGRHWTERQQLQDVVLGPVSEVLIDRAAVRAGETVIDVGCGCGATSFDLLKKIGPTGRVVGVDISEPMLGRARELAPTGAPVEFVLADATCIRSRRKPRTCCSRGSASCSLRSRRTRSQTCARHCVPTAA